MTIINNNDNNDNNNDNDTEDNTNTNAITTTTTTTRDTNTPSSSSSSSSFAVQSVPSSISSTYVISSLIQASILLNVLPLKDLIQLTLVSRHISKLVRQHIQSTFYFNISKEKDFGDLRFYQPSRISVYSVSILQCLSSPQFTTITHLAFSKYSKGVDMKDFLPPNLTHLTLRNYFVSQKNFNQPFNNTHPKITHLEFNEYFNHHIFNLPPNLTHLKLSDRFNQLLSDLPLPPSFNPFEYWFYVQFSSEQQLSSTQLKMYRSRAFIQLSYCISATQN